jgi:ubiquinone biosynthesis protein UbiJ
MTPEDEVNMLKGEADAMKSDLDAINKRIEELKTKSSES